MSEAKTSRLLNLLIALLHTERGLSRDRILRDVYGHAAGHGQDVREQEAVLRQFERDKADLRSMGADIQEREGYERMDSAEKVTMYRVDPTGFRLPPQQFTAEESTWLALAALACDRAVAGREAQRALRRLEAAGALPETPPSQVQPRVRLDEPHWDILSDAAARGAEVTFDYHASSTGELRRRRVQPWGLGQRFGQWYLAGHDVDRGAPRVFRLSRIRGAVTAHAPGAFPLPEPGAVRRALDGLEELPERTARLRVAEDRALELRRTWSPSGPGPEGWDRGDFAFRDVSVAAEWLAGFGDAVVVEEPAELAHAVVSRLEGALAALGTQGAPEAAVTRPPRKVTSGNERLERLMDLVPFLLAGPASVATFAERFRLTERQVRQELLVLQEAGPIDSAGFQSYIEVIEDDGVVSLANASELASPRRLSAGEAVTLQLGLQALLPLAEESAKESIARLIDKVGAAAVVGREGLPQIDLQSEPQRNADLVPALYAAATAGETLRLRYLNPTKDEVTERLVNPLGILSEGNRWYLNSYCHRAGGRRVFRIDRIESVAPAAPVPVPPDFEPGGDALFTRRASDVVAVVRLAPESLWAEAAFDAEDGRDLEDGSRRVSLRVADIAWLAAFLAQFGGSAALEGPGEAVEACRAWLGRALAGYGGPTGTG